MSQQDTNPLLTNTQSPWTGIVWVFFLVTLGALLGQLVASMLYSVDTNGMKEATNTALSPKERLLMLQALTASSAFILAPVFYLKIFTRQGIRSLFQWRQSYKLPTILTLGMVLSFMVVDTLLIQWNMTIKLPTWLRAFEAWAQENEAILQRITMLLTDFSSLVDLGVGVLVMGLIPAVGEELLFRGLIQNLIHELTKNIHLAIGVSAFIFSAIHLQFYGLLPRFLLGVLFGYVYWWTRDLLFPI